MGAAVRVRGLEKVYQIAEQHRGPLGPLRNLVSRRHRLVRAVDGISFEVGRGEMVGYVAGPGDSLAKVC